LIGTCQTSIEQLLENAKKTSAEIVELNVGLMVSITKKVEINDFDIDHFQGQHKRSFQLSSPISKTSSEDRDFEELGQLSFQSLGLYKHIFNSRIEFFV